MPVSTVEARCGPKRSDVGTDYVSHPVLPPKVEVQRENSLVSGLASPSASPESNPEPPLKPVVEGGNALRLA